MGLYPTYIGELTLGAGHNTITASGYQATEVTLVAHPSNSGVVYVKNANTTGAGFPLAAGERLVLTRPDLHEYTASGVANQRVAFAAYKG